MVAIQRCLYHFFSCPLKGPFGTGWSTPSFGQCPIDADWHSEDEFMTVSIHRYRDQYWRLHRDQYRLSYQYRYQFIQCRRCFETGLFVYVRPFRAWNYVDLHLIVSLGIRPRLVLLELQDGARGMVMFVLVVSSSLILLLLLFLPPNQQFWGHILLCLFKYCFLAVAVCLTCCQVLAPFDAATACIFWLPRALAWCLADTV